MSKKENKSAKGSWKFIEDPEGAYMLRGLRYQEVLDKDARGKRFIRIREEVKK